MKKGQLEMIGLVVVIVLLIIGGMFYVTFSVKSSDKNEEQNKHIQSITANNLVGAIVKIKVCNNFSIAEGVSLCDKNEQLCNENACEFLKKEINFIVYNVTDENYLFSVKKGENDLFNVGNCLYGISSVPYRLDVYSVSYDVVIKLCGKDSTL